MYKPLVFASLDAYFNISLSFWFKL